MIFVYINGPKGPSPQLWTEDFVTGEGKSKPFVAKWVLPPGFERLTLDRLAEMYPVPRRKPDADR